MIGENTNKKQILSQKSYILGRCDQKPDAALYIGNFHALDSSLGSSVFMDVRHPHVCLICGKRGYGKSYTMGVLVEEIAKQKPSVRKNLSIILVDTLGIFWTLSFPNKQQETLVNQWGFSIKGFDIQLFTCSKDHMIKNANKRVHIKKLLIRTADLSPLHWCQLFDIKPTNTISIVIAKAVLHLQKKQEEYTINDIINQIKNDESVDGISKTAAENLLTMAESWSIFSKIGVDITNLLNNKTINIIDLSGIDNDYLKTIITSIIADKLFNRRVDARKITELNNMKLSHEKNDTPLVWLAIDEAQLFLPRNKEFLSKTILKDRWMRQGRQPGLSLILATQKPSLIDPEVFSHSDLIFCHRLTAGEDMQSLKQIHPTYMSGDMKAQIAKLGSEKGVALVIDDTQEFVNVIKIRPRQSWHGGGEPSVLDFS
ncbi:MAG: ATP-binding protein [Thermoplasmatota archaeon]